jgi:hypothetical protein
MAFTWPQIELHFAAHIKAYCSIAGMTPEELKHQLTAMYDGYAFNPSDPDDLYNPWSILKFFKTGDLIEHWGISTVSSWLVGSLAKNLVDALCPLESVQSVQVKQTQLSLGLADPSNMSETEQVVALVHSGDLSIARDSSLAGADLWKAHVPNKEVSTIVLPHLLEKIYGLPPSILSENMARLLVAGKIDEVMEVLSQAWSQHLVSAREDKTHLLETYLSGGLARSLADLRGRFPGVLDFRGNILNEASGSGRQKRLDVAFTIVVQLPGGELRKETHVMEIKVVGDGVKKKGIESATKSAQYQAGRYATTLKTQRECGKITLWGIVFSRSGHLRAAVQAEHAKATNSCAVSGV